MTNIDLPVAPKRHLLMIQYVCPGGLNPKGLKNVLEQEAKIKGSPLKVATVTSDNALNNQQALKAFK